MPRLVDVAFNPAGTRSRRAVGSAGDLRPAPRSTRRRPRRQRAAHRPRRCVRWGGAMACWAAAGGRGGGHPDEPRSAPGDRRPAAADGAGDDYVGRQFEQHALSNALRGGLLGFTAAIMTVGAFMVALRPVARQRCHGWSSAPRPTGSARLRAGRSGPADRGGRAAHSALGSRRPTLGSLAKWPGRLSPGSSKPRSTAALSASPVVAVRSLLFDLFFYGWTTVYCLAVLPAFPFVAAR